MSIVEAWRREWRRHFGPKDERIEAEMNRIYKTGFIMLALGWIALLYYGMLLKQVEAINSLEASGSGTMTFGFLELAFWVWPILTCSVLAVMQCRKGFVDTNRFGETDVFPSEYFMLISAVVGVCAGLAVFALRILANLQVVGGVDGLTVIGAAIMSSCIAVLLFAGSLLAFYLTFLAARRRRRALESELDD